MPGSTKAEKRLDLPLKSVDLANPNNLIGFAQTLKKVIVERNLFINIQGKNYVNVEGWQFAGACTGIVPVIEKLEKVEAKDEIKYVAAVKLISLKNPENTIGRGVAICSSKEKGRGNADEYVIASMAQTRATGKAYRLSFGWLMKMAGYEPTPADEVVLDDLPSKEDIKEALDKNVGTQTVVSDVEEKAVEND